MYATGMFNDDSDIDVWLDIAPSKQEAALMDFRKAIEGIVNLRSISEITTYSAQPVLVKIKLYIEGFSDDNRIELDMQESTRGFLFDRREHDIVVLFDKVGAIKYGD